MWPVVARSRSPFGDGQAPPYYDEQRAVGAHASSREPMLKRLALTNWKSFGPDEASGTIHFAPLTLLVGPNASGKSNVLDALGRSTDAVS